MKKTILILFLLVVMFLTACTSNKGANDSLVNNQQNNLNNIPSNNDTNNPPQAVQNIKEFTVEADDLGLYPDTLTVNKGDKVKITFKVRNDKVYYDGLDFRSSVFNIEKVLPGGTKTIEFTAENTFTYISYWPLTNKQKATGTINVV